MYVQACNYAGLAWCMVKPWIVFDPLPHPVFIGQRVSTCLSENDCVPAFCHDIVGFGDCYIDPSKIFENVLDRFNQCSQQYCQAPTPPPSACNPQDCTPGACPANQRCLTQASSIQNGQCTLIPICEDLPQCPALDCNGKCPANSNCVVHPHNTLQGQCDGYIECQKPACPPPQCNCQPNQRCQITQQGDCSVGICIDPCVFKTNGLDADGCLGLAQSLNIQPSDLLAFNPGLDCNNLKPGQRVCGNKGYVPDPLPKPSMNIDGSCFSVAAIPSFGTCIAFGRDYAMTRAEIESFNQNTWQWGGCASQIFFGQKVCLSPGVPPRPDIDPKAECGLTNINNSTCPLNACCSRWGYCGNGPDFCTFKTGPPGLGCQSNCGGAPPPVCTNTMQYKVGYYASWSTNRPAGCPRSGPASFANSPFTHLHFAFGGIDGNGQLSVTSPQFAEFASIKTINPSMKLIISVGGWAFNDVPVTNNQPDTSGYYSRMVSSSSSRSVFINSVKSFLSQYNLDGIDFDWEYPTAPDRHGTSADGQNYVSLLRELRQAVGNSYSISIAAPASFWYLKGFDIAGMSQYLDYIVYMTYDMHGNWDYANQFVGPSLNVHNNFTEIVQAISMIEKAGVPSNKLLLGLGYYGRSFKLQSSSCTTPGVCQFEDPGTMVVIGNELQYPNTALAGRCTNTGGYLANFEIKDIIARQGVVPRFDGPSLSNILVYNNGRDWIGYDDAQSMSIKTNIASNICLGGTAVWSIDQSWDLNIVSAPACGKHSTLDLNNQCACDADFAFINGYCYYTKCQQNSVWNSDQDACVCNVGFQGSNCTPIPPPTCPEHASVNLFNVCVCDHDFEFQNGVCVYTKCRPNSQWVNDQCVCLNGFEGSDCHPVCQSGFAWNGKQCSLIMILDPICIPGHSCVPVTPGPFPISITLPFSFPGVPIPLVIPSLPFSLNLPGISAPVDVTGESQQDKDKDNEQPSKWDTPTFVSCIYNDPIFDFGVQVSAKLLNPPKDKGRWINICKSLPLTVSDEQLYATTCTVSSDTVTGTFAVDFVDTYDFPEAISCYKPDDFGSYVSSCPLKTGMNKRAPQCDIKSILGTDITPDYWTIQNILAEMKEMNTYVYVPPAEKEDIDMYGKALPDYDFVEAYNNRYPDTAVTVEQVPNKLPVTTFASRNYVFRALNKQDIKTLINNNNNMVPKDQSKKAKYKYLPLDHVAKFAGNSDNFISTTYDMDAARRYAINPLLDGANYNYFVMISLNSPKLVGGGFIDLTVPAVINQCKLDYRTAINVRNRGKRVNKKETTSPEIQNDWDLFHRWVTQVSEVLVETQIPKENIVFQVKVYRQSGAVYFIPKFIETHPWNAGCKARGEDYLCNYSQ